MSGYRDSDHVRLGVMTTGTFGGYERFRDDMRAQGVHVGLAYTSDNPHCATCDEPWPCTAATDMVRRAGMRIDLSPTDGSGA